MSKSYVLVSAGWGERHGELRRGDEEVATLEYEGLTGSRARANVAGEEWSFDRDGILNPVVTVKRGEETVLKLTIRTGGGCEITLDDGRKFEWKAISVWRGELGWTTELGEPVIVYRPKISVRSIEQQIDVLADDLSEETERLLLLAGVYLTKIVYTDVATTTAVLMATSIVS